MSNVAIITAHAYVNKLGEPKRHVSDINNKPIKATIETTQDCPSDTMGEVATDCMQKAWRTGLDPVKDKLEIVLSFA